MASERLAQVRSALMRFTWVVSSTVCVPSSLSSPTQRLEKEFAASQVTVDCVQEPDTLVNAPGVPVTA